MPISRRSLLVCLIALPLAASAHAQDHALDEGSIQVGGSASLTSASADDSDRVTTLSLRPHVDYFVAERLALGAELIASYAGLGEDFSTRTLGIGPAVTFYFGRASSTVHPYVAGRAAMSWVHHESPNMDRDGTTWSATGAAGLLTMLSESVGLTTELFYAFERQEIDEFESDLDTFGLAAGIAAFVF